MKPTHFGIYAGLSIICIICSLSSIRMPWTKAIVKIDSGFVTVSFPVEFGLYSCASKNCEDLQKMGQFMDKNTRRLDEDEVGGSSGTDEENIHLPDLPPLPPIKLPTLPPDLPIEPPHNHDDIKITPPEVNPPDPGQYISKYESIIHEKEEPFREGAIAALTFFTIACVVACGTVGIFVYQTVNEQVVSYDHLMYGISLTILLLLFAPFLYFLFTFTSLNGGNYLEGMMTAVNSAGIGMLFSVGAIWLAAMEKRDYVPVRGDILNIEMN